MFEPNDSDLTILKERAFNLRWAAVPPDVIPLTAADPDYKCIPEIHEAIVQYSKERHFSYGPAEGLIPFRESISHWFSRKRQLHFTPKEILPVNSAAYAIYLTCKTILKPGDEALIFDPVDFLFATSIKEVGAIPVAFQMPSANTEFDSERFESLINSRTKLICLCNPLNPTGKVFSKSELQAIGNIAVKHNLFILSDELWSDIVYKPFEHISIASLSPEIALKTITIYGLSKAYALAGLRIGILATNNRELFQQLFSFSLHSSTINGITTLSQIAGKAALDHGDLWVSEQVNYLNSNRDFLIKELNQIKGLSCEEPQGTYLCWINIQKTGYQSEELQLKLFNEAKVALVPGLPQWFGNAAEGHLRLSFATQFEKLNQAINQIKLNL